MATATTSKATRGFARPTGAVRKALQADHYNTFGYVFADGVVVHYNEAVKVAGTEAMFDVYHAFPCKPFGAWYTGDELLIISNPTLLLDGLAHVSVYRNNASDASRDRGIHIDTVTLETQSGLKIRENIFDFLTPGVRLATGLIRTYADFLDEHRCRAGCVVTEHTAE